MRSEQCCAELKERLGTEQENVDSLRRALGVARGQYDALRIKVRSQLIELDRSSAASSSSRARVGGREKPTKRSPKGVAARQSENGDEGKTDSVFGASI